MYEKLIIYETQAEAKAQRERGHQSLKHHLKLPAHHYRCFRRYLLICLVSCMVIEECLTTYSTSLEPLEPQSQLVSASAAAVAARYTETTTLISSNLLPYFDFDVPRNITVTVGQTGFMHCRVERMGDKDVSWIRKRDLHILTAGSTTYTSDQRFQVIRPEDSGNWTLQIKYPQPRDSGIYECQINTEPKMSLSYTFNVIELKANIIGPTDLYVKSGSDINLTCKILQGPHELGNIFWYKGNDIIDMTTNQNEIDSGSRISVDHDWTNGLTSRLKVHHALSSDTGNYTCVPTIAKSASVYVHVIIGEHPAAMQHNSSSMHYINFYTNICCLMLYTILTWCLQHLLTTTISPSMCKRFGGDGDGGGVGGSVSIITLSATLGTFLITLSKAKATTTTTTTMPATLVMATVATSVTTSQQSHSKASLPSTTATAIATATATATTTITIIIQTQTIFAKHFSRHRDLLQAEPTRITR